MANGARDWVPVNPMYECAGALFPFENFIGKKREGGEERREWRKHQR